MTSASDPPTTPAAPLQEHIIHHEIQDRFSDLAKMANSQELTRSSFYSSVQEEIERILSDQEYGFYAPDLPYEKQPFYRIVAWNIERGKAFDGILESIKNHPELSKADVLLLTETDSGMARSLNRNIARELAMALDMNYYFAPSYINLTKGNSIEQDVDGENTLALQGNAILSRYPLENLRQIPLKNAKDKMQGEEKRIGYSQALVADIQFPFRKMTVVAAHLDAHSSPRQRGTQIKTILDNINSRHPTIIGGDFNTHTYNTRRSFSSLSGFCRKALRGISRMIHDHHLHPDKSYEKSIFKNLLDAGFDYQSFNQTGVGTVHVHAGDERKNSLMQEVVPAWCTRFADKTLQKHGGKLSLKLDWFAGKWLAPAPLDRDGVSVPKVIQDLNYNGNPVSDHDPILVDVDLYSE